MLKEAPRYIFEPNHEQDQPLWPLRETISPKLEAERQRNIQRDQAWQFVVDQANKVPPNPNVITEAQSILNNRLAIQPDASEKYQLVQEFTTKADAVLQTINELIDTEQDYSGLLAGWMNFAAQWIEGSKSPSLEQASKAYQDIVAFNQTLVGLGKREKQDRLLLIRKSLPAKYPLLGKYAANFSQYQDLDTYCRALFNEYQVNTLWEGKQVPAFKFNHLPPALTEPSFPEPDTATQLANTHVARLVELTQLRAEFNQKLTQDQEKNQTVDIKISEKSQNLISDLTPQINPQSLNEIMTFLAINQLGETPIAATDFDIKAILTEVNRMNLATILPKDQIYTWQIELWLNRINTQINSAAAPNQPDQLITVLRQYLDLPFTVNSKAIRKELIKQYGPQIAEVFETIESVTTTQSDKNHPKQPTDQYFDADKLLRQAQAKMISLPELVDQLSGLVQQTLSQPAPADKAKKWQQQSHKIYTYAFDWIINNHDLIDPFLLPTTANLTEHPISDEITDLQNQLRQSSVYLRDRIRELTNIQRTVANQAKL